MISWKRLVLGCFCWAGCDAAKQAGACCVLSLVLLHAAMAVSVSSTLNPGMHNDFTLRMEEDTAFMCFSNIYHFFWRFTFEIFLENDEVLIGFLVEELFING